MLEKKLITLDNRIDYIIIDEINYNRINYIYLVNENDNKDFCIKKIKVISNTNYIYPLDNIEEYNTLMNLFVDKYTKS